MKMILILLVFLFSNQLSDQDNSLEIHVIDLKNRTGQVILDVFDSELGFPMKTENAIFRRKMSIPQDGKLVFYIHGLKDGEYAFALIHDENENDKLDQNFIGIPKEGAGASNNATGFMRPPSYKDSKFIVTKPLKLTIKMLYF
ncbi:DUF2141 domain-containing protein [Portibacter lacus]|uniref:DUF2141 domain-containing protein n=1 Tax=Portibacter lacus TaxID=1099794 RepID=A0AA37WCZ0_9BACT|nr:DUF2141 domain-containing protein [Portibacter lacus]GLR17261.1 hypothetical protein GCM10007940_18760 [Portibacter lacus]